MGSQPINTTPVACLCFLFPNHSSPLPLLLVSLPNIQAASKWNEEDTYNGETKDIDLKWGRTDNLETGVWHHPKQQMLWKHESLQCVQEYGYELNIRVRRFRNSMLVISKEKTLQIVNQVDEMPARNTIIIGNDKLIDNHYLGKRMLWSYTQHHFLEACVTPEQHNSLHCIKC